MQISILTYRKTLLCIAVSASLGTFSNAALSEIITESREFSEDTTIEETRDNAWRIVDAGEGKTIELTSKNGSSLTLKSDWSAHVGAHDGGAINFKDLGNLTVQTGFHGLNAEAGSTITVDVAGKVTLTSSGQYSAGRGSGILTGEEATNTVVAGGDIDIEAYRAINNSGTASLTGENLFLTGTGDAAVLNLGGTTTLTADGESGEVEIKNTGTEEKSYGIWSQSGDVEIHGAKVTVSSANDTGILFTNGGAVQIGAKEDPAGTVNISGSKYGVNSWGSGEDAGGLTIRAGSVEISSAQGGAVGLGFGKFIVDSDSLMLTAEDAVALEVGDNAVAEATAGNAITLNSSRGIRNSGDVTLTSQGSLAINATGGYGLQTTKGTVSLTAGSNEGDLLSIKATGEDSNGIFATSTDGSGTVKLSGGTVTVEGANTGITAMEASLLQFGTDGEIGSLTVTGGNHAMYYNSTAVADVRASNFTAKSTSDCSIDAARGTLNITATNATVESADSIGLNTGADATTNINASDTVTFQAGGLAARTFGKLNIRGKTEGSSLANLKVISDVGNGIASCASDAEVTINAVNSTFITNDKATGEDSQRGNAVSASKGGELIFKDTGNADQKITVDSRWGALFSSDEGSVITVESGAVDLTGSVLASSQGTIKLGSVNALNTAQFRVEPGNSGADRAAINARNGSIAVHAVNAVITSDDYAVLATGSSEESADSTVDIETTGSLVITGDIAANIERNGLTTAEAGAGDRTVHINQEKTSTGTITITGDVSTVSDAETTSVVKIGLKTAESSLTGAVSDTYVGDDLSKFTGGTTLDIENGASWNVTGDSSVQNVTGNNGTIVTNGNRVAVDTLVNEGEGIEFETNSGKAGQIAIENNSGDFSVHVTEEGVREVNGNNIPESFADIVSVDNTRADTEITLYGDESGVIGETVTVLNGNGEIVSFSEKANTVTSGLENIAASNFLFFRSTMNDVNKRMGDLRTMPQAAGAWARYYGGKMKYGDRNMDTQYNTLQLGVDNRSGNFYYGLTASISDGDGDLDNGSVDNRNYGFGVYGGWVAENGQFLDVTLKRHRIETEGSLSSTSGTANRFDYYSWGTSVSLEYGWRIRCPNTGFWLEPQAEIMYGHLEKADFDTSTDVNVEYDAVETLVGRIGTAIGYTFDEGRGSAYFKASVLHDWKGETHSTMTANGLPRDYEDDLGGTWGEFALGGTYNISDRFAAYGDILTTTGSPVRSPWEVSVGLRWTF